MAQALALNSQASLLHLVRQAGVLVALAASVALGLYVVLWARTPEFTVLYTDLSDRDLSAVVDALRAQDIAHRMDTRSGAVMVAAAQVHDARLKLAAAGLPKSAGMGFEMLDQEPGFGTSQFLEQARYQRAIEGELSRSIAGISNVRSARVHLAVPKQTAFARNRANPTASVIVDLYNGRRLEPHQVGAVVHMVSASVPGLSPEQVTVIDQHGSLLTHANGGTDDMVLSAKRFEYTRTLEQSYIDRVEAILMPLVGADGVRAQVTADLDFTATEQTRESFNPDLPSVRSESLLEEERAGSAPGGVPGALSNEPPGPSAAPEDTTGQTASAAGAEGTTSAATAAASVAPAASAPTNRRNQTTRNYELDRTISHTRPAVGSVRRLSVAVVVRDPVAAATDASAPAAPAAPAAADAGTPAATGYSEADIERMTNLVKEAIGFDATRGDSVRVTSAEFQTPPPPEALPEPALWEQPWVWSAGKQVLGGLFALFILFGVIRPTVKTLMSKPAGMVGGAQAMSGELTGPGSAALLGAGGQMALAGPGGAPMALPSRQVSSGPLLVSSDIDPNIDQVKQFVNQDPRVAAQVIKGWVGE